MNKVYVSSSSLVSSLGMDLASTWDGLLEGRSGIRAQEAWTNLCEESYISASLKDYQPRKMVPDPKWLKLISRQDVIGINAAIQAVDKSALIEYRESLSEADKIQFNDNTGIYVGSAGNKYFQQYDFMPLFSLAEGKTTKFADHLFETVHPMWLLKILPNNVLAYTGIQFGFKGANQNIINHANSGLQALIEAYWAVALGQLDRAVVVAYDSADEPQSALYYKQLGTVSEKGCIRPFDALRDGTVLGEGAAAFVIESEASLKARDLNPEKYIQILGGKSASENQGLFGLDSSGEILSKLIQDTLNHCEISLDEVGLITAHGNGNIQSDATEAQAIEKTFKECPPVTAFKWAVGHTLCASGLVDATLMVHAMSEKKIPGIKTLQNKASECAHLNISSQTREFEKNIGLIIGRGFGGMDSCVVFKRGLSNA